MCLECLKHRASEWTGRLLMESVYYEYSTFATFTYSDDFLPSDGVSRDVMTHLTRRLYQRNNKSLRYYGVGEYGGTFSRPHYHFILFGVNLLDSPLFTSVSPNFDNTFRCDCPSWRFGHVVLEDACGANMAYVAGYVKSKLNPAKVKVLEAGRNPTCNTMSLKPPIGYCYMLENKDKLIADGCVKLGGHEYVLPTYFKQNIMTEKERMANRIELLKQHKELLEQDVVDLGSRSAASQMALDRLRVRSLENDTREYWKCSKR